MSKDYSSFEENDVLPVLKVRVRHNPETNSYTAWVIIDPDCAVSRWTEDDTIEAIKYEAINWGYDFERLQVVR